MLLTQQLARFLKTATKDELKDFQFKLNHPEYEHRPVSMQEFIENPTYTHPSDAPRPNNKRLLIDFFDDVDHFDDFMHLGKYEEMLYIAGIGCHSAGTELIKSNGDLIKVEDIVVGDKLMGDDGTERIVKTLIRNTGIMYKITPETGDYFIVNGDHILSLKNAAGDIINVSVVDYIKSKNKFKLYRSVLHFKDKNTTTSPYSMGRWIIEMDDVPFINIHPSTKYIADEYKLNSIENRLALIAGLVDGCMGKNIITVKYSKLRDDILFVLRSIGFYAHTKVVGPKKRSRHQITFHGKLSSIPTKIPKNRFAQKEDTEVKQEINFQIEKLGKDNYYGFTLDKNNLYLLSDLTVTHNSGKCLAYGTNVLMHDGTRKKVEDVRVGDQVMGDNGTPRNVLTTVGGRDEMYKLTPFWGDPFVVNSKHILSFKDIGSRHKRWFSKENPDFGKIVNISVGDYLKLSEIEKERLYVWRVGGVDFPEKELPIDPYLFGLWLGDGNKNVFGITTMDDEIRDEVYKTAKDYGLFVTVNKNENKRCPTYIITTQRRNGPGGNPLIKKLRELGVLNKKSIPEIYQTGSRQQRLEILAGLIDTDGSLSNGTYFEFSNKNEQIIDATVFIARSLGFRSNKSKRKTSCNGKLFESFRVGISGNISIIPVKLRRKKPIGPPKRRNIIGNNLVRVKSFENIGEGRYAGFSVDGNHLFCLGDFTVTHNSYCSSKCIQYVLHRLLCLKSPQQYFGPKPNGLAPGSKIAFINISKSFSQAKDVVFGEIKNRIDHSPWFQQLYPPDPRIKSVLKFKKNIFVLPLASNEEAPLGYNIFGSVIDEASFHLATKDKDYAEEAYNQIKKRLRSRFLSFGKLFIITSPRYVNDFAERKYRDDESTKVFKRRVPLWDAMPPESFCGDKFDIGKYLADYKGEMCPVEYENEFIQNPEKAMRDYGARASLAIEAFFKETKIITLSANANRKHPYDVSKNDFYPWFFNKIGSPNYDSRKYFIHCDLGLNKGGKGDAAGLAMVGFDGWQKIERPDGKPEKRPRLYVAYMERIEAGPKQEILFSSIRERIYRLKEIGYNISMVSFDGWNSVDSIQTLNSTGFKAEVFSVDRNPSSYYTVKSALLEGRLDYYYYKPFIEELQQLEEIKGNKIDHPRMGCFTGDTEILLTSGDKISLRDLYDVFSNDDFDVMTIKGNQMVGTGVGYAPRLTKKKEPIVKLGLSNGYSVRCTPDHRFMLDGGSYVKAEDLSGSDILKNIYDEEVTLISIEDCGREDVYDISVRDTHNFILADGTVVHNSKDVCISGETEILVADGSYMKIKNLVGWDVSVIACNNNKICEATGTNIRSTGVREDVIRISFDDGSYLDCTKDHKILIDGAEYLEAGKLKIGENILKFDKNLHKKIKYGTVITEKQQKVVKIEEIDAIEVFDMTVPKLSNFCLKNGIFVHNCDAVAGATYHAAQGTPGVGIFGIK